MTTRDQYAELLKQSIDDINQKMGELEATAKKTQADMQAEFEKNMAPFREQLAPLVSQLEKWREESEERLEEYTREAKKVQDAFIHSYHYFQSQIK